MKKHGKAEKIKFPRVQIKKMENGNFLPAGWGRKKFHPGGTAETNLFFILA